MQGQVRSASDNAEGERNARLAEKKLIDMEKKFKKDQADAEAQWKKEISSIQSQLSIARSELEAKVGFFFCIERF